MALVSPTDCLWQKAILPFFAFGCYLCTFWALVFYAGNPSLGFRPRSSPGNPTSCLIIALVLPPVGAQPALMSLHQTPYQTGCAEAGWFCVSEVICFSLAIAQLFVLDGFSTIVL